MESVSYVEKSVRRGVVKKKQQQQLGKSVRQLSAKGLKVYNFGRKRSLNKLLQSKQKFVEDAAKKLREELAEARAEASEFITSPHLLFRPLSLAFFGLAPLALPLIFVPWKILACYVTFVLLWYLFCIAFVATEISMRPPWYRYPGLPSRGNPPYWRDAVNDPLTNLSLPFSSVEFCRTHGASSCASAHRGALRGWYIPASGMILTKTRTSGAVAGVGIADGDDQDHSSCTEEEEEEDRGCVGLEEIESVKSVVEKGPQLGKESSSAVVSGSERTMAVCVHGAGRDRRAFLRHAEALNSAGMDVLLFDLSEHGLSDGSNRGFSFGVREAVDVAAAVQFARAELNATRVVLIGTSTGATSSILAVADLCRRGAVQAIVAENPFARPADLFCHHVDAFVRNYLSQNQHHVWRRLVFWLFSRVLLVRVGLSSNYGAVDAVPRIRCPLLVMHSPNDEVVPFSHGQDVFEAACEPREFWNAPNVDHCQLFDKYPQEWTSRVQSFINRSLSTTAKPASSSSASSSSSGSVLSTAPKVSCSS